MAGRKKPIYQRGEYSWQVRVRRNGESLTRTFDNYAEAERWHDRITGKVAGHEVVDTSAERATKLRDLLQRYLAEVTPAKKGAVQERYRIGQWLAEEMAGWSVNAISSVDVAEWRNAREAEGKAPSTISNAMNLLSAVYKMAASEWGYRIANPVSGVARPKPRAHRRAHLAAAPEAALIEAAAQSTRPWLVWCVRLALATAMRAGEIRRLEWQHIHDTHIHLPQTKNDTARDVPLTSAAARVVAEMRATLPHRSDGFVFDPDAVTKAALSYQYKQARDRAVKNHPELENSLRSFRFHDGRHVAITRLAKLHKNVLELAATTGHKTLNVLNVYYNPTPEERAAEMRAREAELAPESAQKPRKARRAKGSNVIPIRG